MWFHSYFGVFYMLIVGYMWAVIARMWAKTHDFQWNMMNCKKKIVWLEISTKIHYHLETLWIRRYNRTSLTSAYVSKYLHIANIVFHCLHDELWVHRGFRWKISFRSYLLSPRYLSNLINYIYSWTRVRFTIISLIQWWAGIHCAFINNCFGGENSKKNRTHKQI